MSEAQSAARVASVPRSRLAAWAALALLAGVAWREGVAFALSSGSAADAEHVFFAAADNPPWLVTSICVALLVSRRRDLARAVGAPGAPAGALALFAPGLALLAWGHLVAAPDLSLAGTIASALGAAYAVAGAHFARLVALPVALLAFAVPIPGVLVNQVVWPLQLWTATYAHALLRPLDLTMLRTADLLRTPDHSFIVIEACSGLGSIEVLVLLSLAWAWHTGAGFWHGAALAAAAPFVAFALNGFRVAGLVLYPDSGFWSVHTTQGIVTFALGTLCIALLDRWIVARLAGRGDADPGREAAASRAAREARVAQPPVWLLAALGAAALATLALPRVSPPPDVRGPALLPEAFPGFRAVRRLEPDRLYLGSLRYTRSAYQTYERKRPDGGAEAIAVFVGEDSRRHRLTSPLSPKNGVPGRGWSVERRTREPLPYPFAVERVEAQGEQHRLLAYQLYLGVEGVGTEALRSLLALDRSPLARPGHAFAVRLETVVEPTATGLAEAEARLRDALRELAPWFRGLAAWKRPSERGDPRG